MPLCVGCAEEKPEAEFRFRADRNWHVPRCKPCERKVQLHYYYKAKNTQPLEWRLRVMRNNVSKKITAEWLKKQLTAQDGKCGLSGRPIDLLTCEVDHILPRTRGGSDDLENLRLVCTRANEAKGNMTDEEFLALCREIIGRAIMQAEGLV